MRTAAVREVTRAAEDPRPVLWAFEMGTAKLWKRSPVSEERSDGVE